MNILTEKVLVVSVTFHCPSPLRKFRKGEAVVQKLYGTDDTRADQSQVNANRMILPQNFLEPARKLVRDFEEWLESISLDRQGVTKDLPPLIRGARIVPAKLRDQVSSKLDDFELKYNAIADVLASEYEDAKVKQKDRLKELYDESRYDSPATFRGKFHVTRRMLSWSPDSRQEDVSNALQEIRDALLTGFAEYMEKIFESLAKDDKRYTEKAHVKTLAFLKRVSELNVLEDDQLAKLQQNAQELLEGKNADDIRSNSMVSKVVQKGVEKLGQQAIALMADKPKRKFSFGLGQGS